CIGGHMQILMRGGKVMDDIAGIGQRSMDSISGAGAAVCKPRNTLFNIIYLMRTTVFVIISLCWFCCAYYKRAPRHICFHPLSILHTKGTSMSPRFTQSAEGCERLVVVGLVADFGYQLAVQYLVFFVHHYNRTSSQAGHGAVFDGDAVVADELAAAQCGQVDHVLQAFCSAETGLSKRQVSRNAQNYGIGQIAGLAVEGTYGGGTGGRIDAGEDVQDLALAGEGRQAGIRQVLAYQAEGRCLIANRGESATDADRITAQCNSCHSLAPIARKCIRNRCGRRSPVSWPGHPRLPDIIVWSDRNAVPA